MKRVPQTPCVCFPVSGVPADAAIPPNVHKVPCRDCGTALYAMSSTVALFEGGEAYPTCPACVPALPAGEAYQPTITAAQAEELTGIAAGVPQLKAEVAALTALLGRARRCLDEFHLAITATYPNANQVVERLGLVPLLDEIGEALA